MGEYSRHRYTTTQVICWEAGVWLPALNNFCHSFLPSAALLPHTFLSSGRLAGAFYTYIVWPTPHSSTRAVTLPRHETRWNLHGCPKLRNRSQPLVGQSLPYYEDMWRRYCCLTCFFFPIFDMCLSCKDTVQQSCAMVPRWRFFASFCVLYLQRAACSTLNSDLCPKFALRPHHV